MLMKSGEKATINCPADQDTGRGLNTAAYNMDGDVPERTSGKNDLKYEFEVLECGGSQQAPLEAKSTRDGECINILSSFIK